MGKSNKPTKWFKAVKKAFRSPSKERPHTSDQDTVRLWNNVGSRLRYWMASSLENHTKFSNRSFS